MVAGRWVPQLVEAVLRAVVDTVAPDRAGADEGLKALIAALYVYARVHPELAADPRAMATLTLQTVTDLAARQQRSDSPERGSGTRANGALGSGRVHSGPAVEVSRS